MRKLIAVCGLALLLVAQLNAQELNGAKDIQVFRSASCGCCGKWLQHLKENNFNVKDLVVNDVSLIKAKYGIPKELASCHTALIGGYLVEGHVPASDIEKLLATKPKLAGISVPGMPSGSPGMEMGGRKDPYQVIGFDKDKRQVFSHYGAQ